MEVGGATHDDRGGQNRRQRKVAGQRVRKELSRYDVGSVSQMSIFVENMGMRQHMDWQLCSFLE